jgi:hypothetical protein
LGVDPKKAPMGRLAGLNKPELPISFVRSTSSWSPWSAFSNVWSNDLQCHQNFL